MQQLKRRLDYLFQLEALGLGLVIALVTVAALGYASATHAVERTLEVRESVGRWLTAMLDLQAATRGVLLAGAAASLDGYEQALARERDQAALVRRLLVAQPAQRENVRAAEALAQETLSTYAEEVALLRNGERDRALWLVTSGVGVHRINAFRQGLARIYDVEDRALFERRDTVERRGVIAGSAALTLAVASCVLLVVTSRLRRGREAMLERMAEDGKRRLHMLSDVAAALSGARTCAEVAEVLVEHGMRAAGANTCALYTLDPGGHTLDLIGHRGIAPALLDHVRRLDEPEGRPGLFENLRAGRGIWAENEDEYRQVYPGLRDVPAEGPRVKAFWSLPLLSEGRPVGLLGMGFYQAHTFSDDERNFVETMAQQSAQALSRAIRHDREEEARRWFTTTLVSIGDGVIATDPQGRITFMNPVAEQLTGFSDGDARGRGLDEVFAIFSEKTGEVVESPVAKVLREGTVVGLANHTVLRTRQGIRLPIDDSGAPIRTDDGRLLGVVLVFRDATREKRERDQRDFLAGATQALMSSLDYQTTLAAVARLAVPTIADWCAIDLKDDPDRPAYQAAVAHVEPAKVELARRLGEKYPPDPNARRGVPEVIRTGRAELYPEIPESLLEEGAADAEHLRMIRELTLRSAMVVPLRGRARTLGAITFVYAESGRRYSEEDLQYAQNFADRAALAIENARALKETEAAHAEERRLRAHSDYASRAKDEFLAMVSHELRTPLNAILGWTVTLRRRNPAPDLDRGLSVIERNARAQAKLIEDVLDVSRIISGKLPLNLAPTNIAEAVGAAVETVTPAAEAKNIRVSVEPLDPSLVITADPHRVQQIIWNLLSNAVKFTPKGGGVVVRAYREGSEVRVTVRDSGEGIRREVLPLIFEPFQQADASTTRRHGGLGLGLAIVKQLVNAHGGTVSAESEGQGKGATFLVRLPARSAVPAVSRALPRTAETNDAEPPAGRQRCPRLDGIRLLVVDDERDALMLVGEVLREQGAEVHLAASAGEALDKLPELLPHVVVSDIGMPETDGYTLIRRIRTLPRAQGGQTPAIALTAYARHEDAERALAAGFQRFVAKPVEPDQLAVEVATLSGRLPSS